MYVLISGAVSALAAVAACALFRSYRRLGDRFFAYFAAAFALFGASQLFLGIRNLPEGNYPYAYIPRLIVFVLILIAIVEKNREIKRPAKDAETEDELTQHRLRRVVR
jgi:hypothetical protein